MNQPPFPYQPAEPVNYYGQPPGFYYGYDAAPRRHSGLGITSFVLACVAASILVGIYVYMSAVFPKSKSQGMFGGLELLAGSCFGVLIAATLAVVGAVLGLIGVTNPTHRRGFAIAGLALNVVVLGLFLAAVVFARVL